MSGSRIFKIVRSYAKRTYDGLYNHLMGIPPSPPGTDLVGYETLIRFIVRNKILSVEGDLVEIGTFLGGGAYKLSKFLDEKNIAKKIFVIDIFDLSYDSTENVDGSSMSSIYYGFINGFAGKSQWDIFSEVTKDCNNLVVLRGDSRSISVPSSKLCFGFIDGNHDPEYVENDFYLIWNQLCSNGAIAFHDYDWDLPRVTEKIDEILNRHESDISKIYHNKNKHILFLIKK